MNGLHLEELRIALKEGKSIRHNFLDGGLLYIERPMPFLCVYLASEEDNTAVGRLLMGESSLLVVPPILQGTPALTDLLRTIVQSLSAWWGAVLVLQLRTAGRKLEEPGVTLPQKPQGGKNMATLREASAPPAPIFRLWVQQRDRQAPIVGQLCTALKTLAWMNTPAQASLNSCKKLPILGLYAKEVRQWGGLFIDLSLEHPYIEEAGEVAASQDLRPFMRRWTRILRQTCFDFSRTETPHQPPHFMSLGKRKIAHRVLQVDAQLAKINRQFDFLLHLTPINAAAAWAEFRRHKYEKAPIFLYRPLECPPALLKRALHNVRIEGIEDPTIAHLMREKQDQIDRQLGALLDRNTERFLYGSIQLYGEISKDLLGQATLILNQVSPRSRGDSLQDLISPEEFAQHARREIDLYKETWDGFHAQVHVRSDVAGILVSHGNLLLGVDALIPRSRIEPLLHHEVGTHCLTSANGSTQPLTLLSYGLAGYEGLQEGTAVLSEYLCGGLRRPRLRLLAGRVIAAHAVLQGATFMETFELLNHTHKFQRRVSFDMAMRVHRGGGFIKDKVYLEGFLGLLSYLQKGGELSPLWLGKIAQKHIPLLKELVWREVLQTPPLTPHYVDLPIAKKRLAELREGLTLTTLIENIKPDKEATASASSSQEQALHPDHL